MSFGFGAPAQSQPSLFGAPQQQSQPSLFGAPQQPQQQSQPSLFGAQQSQPSLFGGGQQSQPSLFGAPAQSQVSLFGSGAPASQPSLFGSAQPQSQPSLFGSTTQSQPSLFGGQTQSQPSLFGGQTQSQPSLFGTQQPQQQQPQPSLFGGSFGFQPQQQQQSLLQQQQQQQQQQAPPQLPKQLLELVEQLNPNNINSPFQAALYNVVPASDLPRYTRPPGMHTALWDAAQAANPDPSRQVPVPANQFDDLLTRAQAQTARVDGHISVLDKLEADLTEMSGNVSANLTTKLAAYRRRHRELARKLLRIASAVELAATRADGQPGLSPVEMDRRKRLEVIARAVAAPAEFKDKLSDLVELAEATVLDRRAQMPVMVRDRDSANAVRELLSDQLQGIQHLGNVCNKVDRDIGIVTELLQER